MRNDADVFLFQKLHGDAARNAERRGEPSGKASAAGEIDGIAVFHAGGKVRVAGARRIAQSVIVAGMGVAVADDRRDRAAACDAVFHAAEKERRIALAPRGGKRPASRRAPREEGIERIHIDGKAHGQPFHNDADGLAVRSAEDRDAKVFSQTAHGVSSLFKALKSSPKRG